LETRADDSSGDVEGEREEEKDERGGAKADKTRRSGSRFIICGGREKSKISRDPDAIFPNSVILLPAPPDQPALVEVQNLGQALCEQGFGAEKLDVWELAQQRAGKTPALRINRAVLAPWLADCPPLCELLELLENSEPLRAELDEAIAAVLEWKPN